MREVGAPPGRMLPGGIPIKATFFRYIPDRLFITCRWEVDRYGPLCGKAVAHSPADGNGNQMQGKLYRFFCTMRLSREYFTINLHHRGQKKTGILFLVEIKKMTMIDPVGSYTADIDYKGKKLAITVVQGETLSNDWIDFGVKSDDDTFLHVFGKNPIPMVVKPKQEFKPEYDLFQNTPDQMALAKEIWNAIQRIYF